uniref:RING-type domain-containing protein n=1 Tax=Chromera velia CCMP2878 TaxID=1169474 RepID=A0A0G4H9E8_9ALVE|eukprot:Cvel_25255.t1-p1 / transcript=Cvel_25255.t1 / gene=Cvel_25255 / organism=Chromera_velia_CCMP2878 / gene_product=hypothetical protein / transcript_product=hypothetical protein / location=Cvel_scaffold2834:12429-13226(+) / protein_length=266 / sequence_SO=supercontig / SO=protein_coding / is_pseudo=false
MQFESPSGRPTADDALRDPLFSRESAETAQCVACFEILLRARGVTCHDGARHFLCAECLNRHVEAKTRLDVEYSDVRARFKEGGCTVSCLAEGCPSESFSSIEISWHLHVHIHAQWEGVRLEAAQERLCTEIKREFEQKLKRLLIEDEAQWKVEEIVEEVLTLKYPKCRTAFADFDGCTALTCVNCGCEFCGYCLLDCGRDAHDHVPWCPIGEGMYVGQERWEQLQRERKRHQIGGVVAKLGVEERAEVLHLLQPLMQERGIILES